MKWLLAALAFLCPALAQAGPGDDTLLVSISGLDLAPGERIIRLTLETWGVEYLAVCRIPKGWRVEAGGSAAPDGALIAEASHGASRLSGLSELDDIVLIRVDGQVRLREIVGKSGRIPARFAGSIDVQRGDGPERQLTFGGAQVDLTPAARCPDPAR